MRRNGSDLPARQDWGGLIPQSQSGTSPYYGSPWQLMRRMQEDMDRIFGQLFTGEGDSSLQPSAGQQLGMRQWTPRMDISQTDKEWCIEADLPGVKEEDIDVRIQDHTLYLRAELRPQDTLEGKPGETQAGQKPAEKPHNGQNDTAEAQGKQRQYHQRERRWGYFERVLSLPENVDEDKVSCDFRNGVLNMHVPKTQEPASQGRRIPIGAGQPYASTAKAQPTMAGARGGEASSATEKK